MTNIKIVKQIKVNGYKINNLEKYKSHGESKIN